MSKSCYTILLLFGLLNLSAQEDLLSLLGDDDEPVIEYATAAFKTNRVINLHSIESTSGGVLDVKISHRFGFVNGGISELFGLDAASIRIGADYGITNRITTGFGRSSHEKTYDGFLKYKFLRQSSGAKVMPVTAALFASVAIKTVPWANPDRKNYFTSRLYYTYQLIVGRKFGEAFSLQLSPTLVHRNLVRTKSESNDVRRLGWPFGRSSPNESPSMPSTFMCCLTSWPMATATRYPSDSTSKPAATSSSCISPTLLP